MQRNRQREYDQAALERIQAILLDADDDTLVVSYQDLQQAIQYGASTMRSYHDAVDERLILRRAARALLRLAFPALMQQFDEAVTADDDGQSCHMVRHKLIQEAINRVDWNDAPNGRAACPLCREETQAGRGFLVLGLERHLSGWRRSPPCDVIQAFDRVERYVGGLPRHFR